MDPEDTPASGTPAFRIQIENEDELIRHAVNEANHNIHGKPGEFWLKLNGVLEQSGTKHQWMKVYHVDVIGLLLEVTETWNGVEVARRAETLDLEKYG